MGNIFATQKSHGMKRLVFNMVYRMDSPVRVDSHNGYIPLETQEIYILPVFLRDVAKYYWNEKQAVLQYSQKEWPGHPNLTAAKCLIWAIENRHFRLVKCFNTPRREGHSLYYENLDTGYEVRMSRVHEEHGFSVKLLK